MNALTLFGFAAVSLMLACYALEQRSRWFILGFAIACAMGSTYGFLQAAWPFGLVEGIWAVFALQRWHRSRDARFDVVWSRASRARASRQRTGAATSYRTHDGHQKHIEHYQGDDHAPEISIKVEDDLNKLVGIEQWIGTPAEREASAGF